uniref:Uncharacterized protein n=1 Tax=Anguilla anguilla TaxID=7936 RepID=A0A0E9UX76_ANGAN
MQGVYMTAQYADRSCRRGAYAHPLCLSQ